MRTHDMPSALIVIDVQNDFCEGGSLPVPDADAVVSVANALVARFVHVVFTQDWHPRGHVSFASSHRGCKPFSRIVLPDGERQTLWPDHCVAGTPGAGLHPRLYVRPGSLMLRKGVRTHSDSYSAFFENDHHTPVGLDQQLRDRGVDDVVLAGLATDVCVLRTALDARRLGYSTTVVEAGCRGIDVDGSVDDAWEQMTRAGVRRG